MIFVHICFKIYFIYYTFLHRCQNIFSGHCSGNAWWWTGVISLPKPIWIFIHFLLYTYGFKIISSSIIHHYILPNHLDMFEIYLIFAGLTGIGFRNDTSLSWLILFLLFFFLIFVLFLWLTVYFCSKRDTAVYFNFLAITLTARPSDLRSIMLMHLLTLSFLIRLSIDDTGLHLKD